MALPFRGCVGSSAQEALMNDITEAVKENALSRLTVLMTEGSLAASDLDRKQLIHKAAWLGYTRCVQLLLENGASPDDIHKKNGCTPLHLAHFCQVEDTNPQKTIELLVAAGASVNNPGGHKCGKLAVDHAVQHQRLDAVQALIQSGSDVTLQSVLIAIDVTNPQILEVLLTSGGQCGKMLESVLYWGQPLHRVIYTPMKCPRECYKMMFRMLVQATVCTPILNVTADTEPSREPSNMHLMIETELKTLAKDYTDVTQYLFASLVRNGFYPSEHIKYFMGTICDVEWLEDYLKTPATLQDLCVRVLRSHLYLSGNISYGSKKLHAPREIKNRILMIQPL